jgi:hypothetical protein
MSKEIIIEEIIQLTPLTTKNIPKITKKKSATLWLRSFFGGKKKKNTYFTFVISISPIKGIAFCKLLLISVCK